MCQMSPLLKSGANLWSCVIRGFKNYPPTVLIVCIIILSESVKCSSIETILAMPPGRRRPRCTSPRPTSHELSNLPLLHSHVVYKQPVREDSLHIGGKFLHHIIVQRPKPLYAIEICERETKERDQ
jgi:hypothetical protein